MTIEDVRYKHDDYAVRSNDAYALTKYRIILNWLPMASSQRILNAGCGSGEMTALLARNPLWYVDAFDVDEEAIQLSQTLKGQLGLTNVTISKSDIESFSGADYDIIICNDVLEHLAHPEAAISKLVRMLKPGGILCISVPALQWLFGYHDELLGHYRRYNRHTLSILLTPYVSIKRCRYFGFTLIPIAIWYSLLARKNYPVSESTGSSLRARILNIFLGLEQRFTLPLGTSLLSFAVKPE